MTLFLSLAVRQTEEGREMGAEALCPGLGGDSEDGRQGSDGERPWAEPLGFCGLYVQVSALGLGEGQPH